MKLIQLEQKDLKELKRKLHTEQGFVCPISGYEYTPRPYLEPES